MEIKINLINSELTNKNYLNFKLNVYNELRKILLTRITCKGITNIRILTNTTQYSNTSWSNKLKNLPIRSVSLLDNQCPSRLAVNYHHTESKPQLFSTQNIVELDGFINKDIYLGLIGTDQCLAFEADINDIISGLNGCYQNLSKIQFQ